MKFETEELRESVLIALSRGYSVWVSKHTPAKWVVISDDLNHRIGMASAGDYGHGVNFGTMHKPHKSIGTGFGQLAREQGNTADTNSPKDLDLCFNLQAYWHSGPDYPIKWKGIEEYTESNKWAEYRKLEKEDANA